MPFIIIDHGHPAIVNYQHKIPKGTASVKKGVAAKQVEKHEQDSHIQASDPRANPYSNTPSSPQRVFLAKDIMSQPAVFIDVKIATIELAWQTMHQHKIKHLPITKNGKLFGIVSDRDILHSLAFHPDEKSNWFKQKVHAATIDTDIHQLAHTMFDQHIGTLPIVNEQQQILGLVTRSDILKLTSHYGPMEFWA